MKIGVAQLNFKVGDLRANADLVVQAARNFSDQGCSLAVFPELALTGYYPWDLLEQPGFITAQLEELDRVARLTAELQLSLAVGCVTHNGMAGKPFHNSFTILKKGQIVCTGHKQLLPTYNIFDERRHFEPGHQTEIIDVDGMRIAFLICEDAWNDGGVEYTQNPVSAAVSAGAQALITLNASPWQTGKHFARLDLFSTLAQRHRMPLLYVNQVGAHDEIIYDGASFATDSNGTVTWRGHFAKDQQAIVELADGSFTGPDSLPWPTEEPAQQLAMIELGLRDYMTKCGFKTVVVGSSGGIDSALTLAIAERVVGAANIMAITMPSKYSSTGSITDSQDLCDKLGVELVELPIKDGFDAQIKGFSQAFGRMPSRIAIENTQARLRGLALMSYSNDTGALLLSTGNKSEVSVGYCTLYGDMNGGLNLIGDLYKTEVYRLAEHINVVDSRAPIPRQVIDKPPSAELFEDQVDSDSLPPYEELDAILRLYIERDLLEPSQIERCISTLDRFRTTDSLIEKIMSMVDRSEFKRWQACPILRVHARAFGTGRRYPIAQGFRATASMLRTLNSRPLMAKS